MMISNIIYPLAFCSIVVAIAADLAGDAKILEKCLREISTPERINSDLKKLERYGEWTREELPCLMRCVASEKGWFDIESNKWQRKRVADELGADIYNYCRFELLRRSRDGCNYAYRGLRCLKQAEIHAGTSLATLLQCSRQLNATNLELLQYSKLKTKESIPCLFKCFADALNFYDEQGNWRLRNWEQAFGPSRQEQQQLDYSQCWSSKEQRQAQTNQCSWMYDEYICWERLNGNVIVEQVDETKSN